MGLGVDFDGHVYFDFQSLDYLSSLQCVGVGLGAAGMSCSVPQTSNFVFFLFFFFNRRPPTLFPIPGAVGEALVDLLRSTVGAACKRVLIG